MAHQGELRVNGWPLLEGGEPEFACSCRSAAICIRKEYGFLVRCPHCGAVSTVKALVEKWKRDFME